MILYTCACDLPFLLPLPPRACVPSTRLPACLPCACRVSAFCHPTLAANSDDLEDDDDEEEEFSDRITDEEFLSSETCTYVSLAPHSLSATRDRLGWAGFPSFLHLITSFLRHSTTSVLPYLSTFYLSLIICFLLPSFNFTLHIL